MPRSSDSPLRIVLCDDHGLFREALASVLRARGHEVAETASPHGLHEEIDRLDADVCVLDVSFPEGNGIEAARSVTRSRPQTRLLMLSAADEPGVVAEALSAGAAGFARKDQDVRRLLRAIRAVAAGETVVDEMPRASQPRSDSIPPDASRRGPLKDLTDRERQVLGAILRAETTQQMAQRFGIATSTARTHVNNVLMKLGVHTRLQAAAVAYGAGFAEDQRQPESRCV